MSTALQSTSAAGNLQNLSLVQSFRNIRGLTRDPIALLKRLQQENLGAAVAPLARIGSLNALVVQNTALADKVLTSPNIGPATMLMDVLGQKFGKKGPFTSDGRQWKEINTLLRPLFARDEVLRGPKAKIVQNEIDYFANGIVRAACHGHTVDILARAEDLTMNMACKAIIGAQLSSRQISECRHDLEGMVRTTFELMNNPLLLLSPWHLLKARSMTRRMHKLVYELMDAPPPEDRFITALSILHKAREEGAIDSEMFFSCIIQLLVAGHETTAAAIAWIVRYIATHDEQVYSNEKLIAEAKALSEVLPGCDIDRSNYPNLGRFVAGILMESSPIISVFRSPYQDVTIDLEGTPVTFKKGAVLYVPLLFINRAEHQGRGCPNSVVSTRVFSRGQRTCPGNQLATNNTLMVAARILEKNIRFNIVRDDGYTADLAFKPKNLLVAPYQP